MLLQLNTTTLMAGNEQIGFDIVKACKEACAKAGALLKVIIETGELKDPALIRKASEMPSLWHQCHHHLM